MKKLIYSCAFIAFNCLYIYGQNTFPTNGNVGIGTAVPSSLLTLDGTGLSRSDAELELTSSNGLIKFSGNSGPHAILFDEQGDENLSLVYRSTPHALRILKDFTGEPNTGTSLFSVDYDTQLTEIRGLTIKPGRVPPYTQPELEITTKNALINFSGDEGPHGLIFNDNNNKSLSLVFRSRQNRVNIEKDFNGDPSSGESIFSVDYDGELTNVKRLRVGGATNQPEIELTARNSLIRFSGNFGPHGLIFDDNDNNSLSLVFRSNQNRMRIEKNFNGDPDSGESIFSVDFDDEITRVKTLQILGGSDIAEPFHVSEEKLKAKPGHIMVLDEENPGSLKLSAKRNDTKVIGVISGANGINTGMSLTQNGVFNQGQNIALVGRVYVKANLSNGEINIGDFITTSDVPGEAMKVSNIDMSRGAILGKSMSQVDENGFILLFLSLQ